MTIGVRHHVLVFGLAGMVAAAGNLAQSSSTTSDYKALVAFFDEWRKFQPPKVVDGVPDYTPAAMEAQHRELKQLQDRLAAIDVRTWTNAQKVDYLLVKAELNGLDFNHRVIRPWFRDPGFYVTTPVVGFMPMMHDTLRIPRKWTSSGDLGPIVMPLKPDEVQRFRTKLTAAPKILDQAKRNLTEAAGDLARLAIRAKRNEADIYRDLARQAAKHHPDLVPLAEQAAAAVEDFRAWLETNEGRWSRPAGIGVDNYDWYLRHVLLFPYTWQEIRVIGNREYERAITFLKLEENKNRAIPMIEPALTEQEHLKRHREADLDLLTFLKREQIFTVPDYLTPQDPESFDRPGGVRNFFQQAGDRDPRPLRAHNLPGHRLDSLMRERDNPPPRGGRRLFFIDGIRADGWAFYLEEMTQQAGWLDKRPKTREINYILQAKRAARVAAELKMHSQEFTFKEAFHHLVTETPYWMGKDDSVAWYDLELYLRQPGYGMGYFLGKVEIERLLTDRVRQLGDRFKVHDFHDQFLAAGVIPTALIRWEMTGLDNEVKTMWGPGWPGER